MTPLPSFKSLLIPLVLFTLVITAVVAILITLGATFLHETIWYIIGFIFIQSVISLAIGYRGLRKSQQAFVTHALGSTVVRLVLSVVALYIALKMGVDDRLRFVLNFMAVYFVFLVFELYSLLTTLRANFENPT